MNAYENLVRTMATPALVHLIETKGTVGPEHKDVIAAELDRRGVTYNRPARPAQSGHVCVMQETPDGYGCVACLYA